MAFHGHTTVELTNVKTGEVQRFDDDNTFTTWYRDIATPFGGCSIFQNKPASLLMMMGGLRMFNTQLNESDYSMPQASYLEAWGSDAESYDSDMSRGIFNVALSDLDSPHRRKLVWDFDLDHGNGRFNCISLANKVEHLNDVYYLNGRTEAHNGTELELFEPGPDYFPIVADEVNGKFICGYIGTDGVLHIRKYDMYKLRFIHSGDPKSFESRHYDDYTVDIHQYINGKFGMYFYADGNFYVFSQASDKILSNNQFTFAVVNVDTLNMSTKTVSNLTGETIQLYYVNMIKPFFLSNNSSNNLVMDGILLCETVEKHIWGIEFDSSTPHMIMNTDSNGDVAPLEITKMIMSVDRESDISYGNFEYLASNWNRYESTPWYFRFFPCRGKHRVLCYYGETATARRGGYDKTDGAVEISIKDYMAHPILGSATTFGQDAGNCGYYVQTVTPFRRSHNVLIRRNYWNIYGNLVGTDYGICIYPSNTNLVTINNLEREISKTPDMTMRIIYIIEEEV